MGRQLTGIARLLGNTSAHIQHGIDRAIEWGFAKMKEQDAHRAKKTPTTPVGRAAQVGRGIIGLIGSAGDAYYSTYEQLKRKK